MNKLIYGVLGLIALLIAAALAGPSFVDWNRHKDRIAAEVQDLTGRRVAIGGDVQLSLLPAPTLSAEEVRLAGAFGADQPELLDLRELQVRIAWLPLLRGRVQIDSIVLVEPGVHLEILEDGRRNWDVPVDASRDEAPGGSNPARIGVESFSIRNGAISYRDRRSGPEVRVERLRAEITAASLAGPFEARGTAEIQGTETVFELITGVFAPGGATRSSFELELPAAKSRASFAGSFSPNAAAAGFSGRFQAEGESFRSVLHLLLGDDAPVMAAAAAKPFALTGTLDGDPAFARVEHLELRLGEARLGGEASVRVGEGLDLNLRLRAARLDFDALLSHGQAAPAAEDQAAALPGKLAGLGEFSIWDGLAVRLDLAIDAADYRGQALRDLSLRAALAGGQIAVEQASVLLPGRSVLRFDGLVAADAEGPRLEGRLEARSDNLRRLFAWLGYRLGQVPPNRLRRLSLAARLSATASELGLHDLEGQLDLTKLTGGLVVALRERPGLGIGLMADQLDLGSYLMLGDGGRESPASQGDSANSESPDLRDAAEFLDLFDANLDMRIGALDFLGVTARGIRVDALLQDGSLTLRRALAKDLAGGKARLSGIVSALTGQPAIDGELEIDLEDPRRLARLLDLDPVTLARLGAVSVKSGFAASAGAVTFDAALAALGGTLDLSGKARLDAGPPELSARMEVMHPDLSHLAGQSPDGPTLEGEARPLELRAALDGTLLAMQATDLTARLGDITLNGKVAADLSGARPAITADLDGGVLTWQELVGLLGGAGAAPPADDATEDSKRPWSWTALDFGAWRGFDAQLALRLRELVAGQVRLQKVSVSAALNEGVLRLRNMTGEAYGGRVEMTGRMTAAGRPEGRLRLHATAVDLEALLREHLGEHLGFAGLSGPVDFEAELTTRGQSEAQLISALSGEIRVMGRLVLASPGVDGRNGTGGRSRRPEDLRTVADGLTFVAETFAGPAADFRGLISIKNGVFESRTLQLLGEGGRLDIHATADLPRWRLDSTTDLLRDDDGGTPYLSLRLTGPLDEPDVLLGGSAFGDAKAAQDDGTEAKNSAAGSEVLEPGLEQLLNDLAN